MSENAPLYERLIYENEVKAYQVRLVVNEYKEKYYVHLRKYFLSYEGEYVPSQEGIGMEASFYNIIALMDGLVEILSKEESKEIILKHFKEILNDKS